jgi:DNA adenine methylase
MIFRYPGSKSRSVATIMEVVARYCESVGWDVEYREPFFGAGSVGFSILKQYSQLRRAWFNDRDPGVACIWERVLRSPEELIERLGSFVPEVEQFFDFRDGLRQVDGMGLAADRLDFAFRKIAIHQMSRNGLGTRSGGPIGGRDQSGRYKIDSRYSMRSLAKSIRLASGLLGRVRTHPDVCSCIDFELVI